MAAEIALQPKQSELYRLIKHSQYSVIGVGGGRGSAKSSGADRCAITLMHEWRGLTVCLIMRTWVKQMVPFHLEAIRRDFPWLSEYLTASPPAMLRPPRTGLSRMEFKYAENYDAVEEAFRSGNYDLVLIDQAEQFSWREIVEIRKAARSTGGRQAKLVLLFNMRGAYIGELRKIFRDFDVPSPEDYTFLKVNPWDNVEWVRAALTEDGYTVEDYYSWTDEQRKAYAAVKGPYTKQLATDDPVIAKADWEGDWDSLEGAYFSGVFDLQETRLPLNKVLALDKNWAQHWMSQDWGKAHFNATYWHYRVTLAPSEVKQILGWERQTPLIATVTHREMIVNEQTATEVARNAAHATPAEERKRIRAYFLSPECVTEDPNSVGSQQAKELRPMGLPGPIKADNDRIGGWSLMANLLKATRLHGVDHEGNELPEAWFISAECPKLLDTIPMLMRDPKNLDDVLKTDKGYAQLEMDVGDAARYGLKSMLSPKKKTEEDTFRERQEQLVASGNNAQVMVNLFRHEMGKQKKRTAIMPPSWRGNLR